MALQGPKDGSMDVMSEKAGNGMSGNEVSPALHSQEYEQPTGNDRFNEDYSLNSNLVWHTCMIIGTCTDFSH